MVNMQGRRTIKQGWSEFDDIFTADDSLITFSSRAMLHDHGEILAWSTKPDPEVLIGSYVHRRSMTRNMMRVSAACFVRQFV